MKRFYKEATIGEVESGAYSVLLDGRLIKTQSKQVLALPSEALAQKVAAEWDNQGDEVNPETMPFMTLSSTTIDNVIPNKDIIAEGLAAYGGSDLVCYWAEHPKILVKRQHDAWQPLVDWAKTKYGISLNVTAGIVHIPQKEDTFAKFNDIVFNLEAYHLTSLHELTTLSGSIAIALAVMDGFIDADDGFNRSIVDDLHQAEFWGADEEADARNALRRQEFLNAYEFMTLLPQDL